LCAAFYWNIQTACDNKVFPDFTRFPHGGKAHGDEQMRDTVILGAGLAGLSTAYHLKSDWEIFEKNNYPGGLAVTHHKNGYSFDLTGHWLHLRDPKVMRMVERLMPDGFLSVVRQSEIFSHGVYTPYPFQTNTYGLPVKVVSEIIQSYVSDVLLNPFAKEPRTFEEWVIKYMGRSIAERFMIPYNEKLWRTHPRDMTPLWCQIYVPKPTLQQIIDGALAPPADTIGYNASFIYPKAGGIGALPQAMAAALKQDRIHYECTPTRIDAGKKCIEFSNGESIGYRNLVSSLPLPELIKLVSDAPAAVRRAASKLLHNQVLYFNIALNKPALRPSHWVYLPEAQIGFYRAGSFSNAAPYMAPEGCGNLYVEYSHRNDIDTRGLFDRTLRDLLASGMLESKKDVEFYEQRNIEYAYVVFDANYRRSTGLIHAWLAENGIRSIGRYGRWTYNSMETAIIDGYRAADEIRASRRS